MNIFFDYQAFMQQYGGISRYFCELINGINVDERNRAHLSVVWSENIHLHEYGLPALSYPSSRGHTYFNKINRLYNCFDAKIKKYDIFHATYFDDFLLPYVGSTPFVTTFYDMTYERLSHRFTELSDDKWIIPQKKKIAQRASHLIAISESTKRDIVELIGVDPEKITVIHLSSPFTQEYNSPVPVSNDLPYLLYVGKRYEYKNFISFLRAIAHVLIRYRVALICAGGGAFTNQERNIIKELSLNELVKYKEIDSESLRNLYKGAVAFVFPSLYEGFGIPVLEAFACNCSCVLSNTSSLPEVAGEAALYMDPADPESMAYAVENVILNDEMRNALIAKGRQRLAHFSWQHMVSKTLNLYKTLV